MTTLAMIGVSSTAIYLVSKSHNLEAATHLNNYLALASACIYGIGNLWLLLVPWCRKRSALKILSKDFAPLDNVGDDGIEAGTEPEALVSASTVAQTQVNSLLGMGSDGYKYWTMETLRR